MPSTYSQYGFSVRRRYSWTETVAALLISISSSIVLVLSHHPGHRTTCRRVQLLVHPPGEIRVAAGFDAELHRGGHSHGVLGRGDRRVQQHSVVAQLHRQRHVGGGAHARVDDKRSEEHT